MNEVPTEQIKRLGVTGWPVAHSRSPVMQNAALAAVGLGDSWHYQHLPIPPELFTEAVPALPASGFVGINVTIPHKQAALQLATSASPRALAIGAANTLLLGPDGSIEADNTDAPALCAALREMTGASPDAFAEISAVVLGAGGSARAAVWALLDLGIGEVRVWNRTALRAAELCRDLGGLVVAEVLPADVIVNCTPVGLKPGDDLTSLPLTDAAIAGAQVIADFVYSPTGTPLDDAAAERGIPFIDGLELLVLQGAESFTRFTGVPAPVEVMRDAARGAS